MLQLEGFYTFNWNSAPTKHVCILNSKYFFMVHLEIPIYHSSAKKYILCLPANFRKDFLEAIPVQDIAPTNDWGLQLTDSKIVNGSQSNTRSNF